MGRQELPSHLIASPSPPPGHSTRERTGGRRDSGGKEAVRAGGGVVRKITEVCGCDKEQVEGGDVVVRGDDGGWCERRR